jgi:hypothetical protein
VLIAATATLVAVAVGGVFLTGGNPAVAPLVTTGSASPATEPSPSRSTALATMPATVDGKSVLSVSEAIRQRDAGDLGSDPVAIRGYWSNPSVAHSCAAPDHQTGDLEIYCHDREFGITELNEAIEIISLHGEVTTGSGPWLTPFISGEVEGADDVFNLPMVNGQRFPPVPIVVVGHFNDPRSKDCGAEAQQVCRDRLVIDRIVYFHPEAVPSPAPSPTPTPFPSSDPPPPPYDVAACTEGQPVKFAGWTTLRSLGIDIASPDEIAYIVITRDAIPIGGWFDDPNDGSRYRLWGQRVCYGYEWDPGTIGFTALPGSEFREYPDGRREPTQGP